MVGMVFNEFITVVNNVSADQNQFKYCLKFAAKKFLKMCFCIYFQRIHLSILFSIIFSIISTFENPKTTTIRSTKS